MITNKIEKSKVIEAILKYNGLVSMVANSLGVDRKTIYSYINEDQDIKDALHQAREVLGDELETILFNTAKAGNLRAVEFTLNSCFGSRGYGNKITLQTTRQEEPEVNISLLTEEEQKQFYELQQKMTGQPVVKELVDNNLL